MTRLVVVVLAVSLAAEARADCLDTATNDCDNDGISAAEGDCDDDDASVGVCENPLADATITGGESCSTGGSSSWLVLLPFLALNRRRAGSTR